MLRNASKILLIIGACYVSLILFSVFLGIAWVPVIAVADELSSDLHGELEWVDASDGEDSLLSYHGNTYYYADSWLESGLKSSDVEIGWQYGIIFPNTSYYTDGSEQPLYILAKGSPSSCGVFLLPVLLHPDRLSGAAPLSRSRNRRRKGSHPPDSGGSRYNHGSEHS